MKKRFFLLNADENPLTAMLSNNPTPETSVFDESAFENFVSFIKDSWQKNQPTLRESINKEWRW